MNPFLSSVLLVLATGLVTVGVAWQQNRFAEHRARRERDEAVEERQRQVGREHALAVHQALNEIVQIGIDLKGRGQPRAPEREVFKSQMAVVREQYLLIPNDKIRTAVADGLTVVIGRPDGSVTLTDWHEAAATASFVIAAYLRGEEAPNKYVQKLRELRDKYSMETA